MNMRKLIGACFLFVVLYMSCSPVDKSDTSKPVNEEVEWDCVDSLVIMSSLNKEAEALNILRKGCRVVDNRKDYLNLLRWGLRQSTSVFVEELFEQFDADKVNQVDMNNLLMEAVRRKKSEIVIKLLDLGANPNFVSDENEVILNSAIIHLHDLRVLKKFVERGAMVTIPEKREFADCEDCPLCYTVIHAAIDTYRRHPEFGLNKIEFLLKQVKSQNDFCNGSGNPMKKAKYWKMDDVIELLKQYE